MSLENEIKNILPKKEDHSFASDLHDASKIHHSIIIHQKPEIVFSFWRDFANLPLFMKNLTSVDVISEKRSHWTVGLSYNAQATWDAEIIAEIPGQMISWRSVGDSEVEQAGSVWFLNGVEEGTCVVRLHLAYTIPGGWLAEFATKLVGEDVDSLIQESLYSLKSIVESNEFTALKAPNVMKKNNLTSKDINQ
ncbi:MAG: SRPBCC family protein [Bdellovibrio sp.]|nr:SRPBCC family protein [Bdellovibrio sp.]